MARPPASNSIAWSTSTCAESTRIAVSGNSARITWAASRPSLVCVGGIRISVTTSCGRLSRTDRQQSVAVAGLSDDVESGSVEQAGHAFAQQHVVIGHDHLDRTHHGLPAQTSRATDILPLNAAAL